MRDHQARDSDLFKKTAQLGAEPATRGDIEGCQRLVKEQNPRLRRHSPRQCNTLRLAARDLARPPVSQIRDLEQPHHFVADSAPFRFAQVVEAVFNVPSHGQVWKQSVLLRQQADLARRRGPADRLRAVQPYVVAELDKTPVGALQSSDRAKQGGLPGSRWPKHNGRRTRSRSQIQAEVRPDGGAGRKALLDVDNYFVGHAVQTVLRSA